MIVGEELANVADGTVLMAEFRVARHHVSDGFHAVRVRLGDRRHGHGSSFSVVVSRVAAAPEEGTGIPDCGSSG